MDGVENGGGGRYGWRGRGGRREKLNWTSSILTTKTPLEHTPKPVPTGFKRDIFHSWLEGLPRVCPRGALQLSWSLTHVKLFAKKMTNA